MIHNLRLAETIQLNKDQLAAIIKRLGPRSADEMISRAMEEIAVQLAKVHKAALRNKPTEITVSALKIAEFSKHIGLPTLSYVATSVAELAKNPNCPSLTAALARLERVGEASLLQIWDLNDLSM